MSDALHLLNFSGAVVGVDGDASLQRLELLKQSSVIKTVEDEFDNEVAVDTARNLKELIDRVEASRKAVKSPVLELGKSIDRAAKDFIAALQTESTRIRKLLGEYALKQQHEIAEAAQLKREEQQRLERERQEAARKLQAARTREEQEKARTEVKEKVQQEAAAKSTPVKQEEKPEGLSVRTVKAFKILDIMALMKARPELVHVTPNRRAIQEAIKTEGSIPGLDIFEETRTTIRK